MIDTRNQSAVPPVAWRTYAEVDCGHWFYAESLAQLGESHGNAVDESASSEDSDV